MKTDQERQTVLEPARNVPVIGQVDVAVVGGSPTGVAAAVSAARQGADILLVERYGCLGGQMTVGMIHTPGEGVFFDRGHTPIVGGFAREMVDRIRAMGGADPAWDWDDPAEQENIHTWLDPEISKIALADMVLEAGVKPLLNTYLADAIVRENRLVGILVENKAGRSAIQANVFVDATGDGDLAARAGVDFEVGTRFKPAIYSVCGNVDIDAILAFLERGRTEVRIYPPPSSVADLRRRRERNQSFRFGPLGALLKTPHPDEPLLAQIQGLELHWICEGLLHIESVSEPATVLDPPQMSLAEIATRTRTLEIVQFCRKHVCGFEKAYLLPMPPSMAVRESRSIACLHRLSNREILESVHFDDAIAVSEGHDEQPNIPEGRHEIPYRALVPLGVGGLLVAGRCVSTEANVARNAVRGIVPCICTGQAAGVAAALVAKGTGDTPADLPITELQNALRAQGVILP